jgi:hypothetical protein
MMFSAGGFVGWMMKTSRPRTFSSILTKISPSANRRSVTWQSLVLQHHRAAEHVVRPALIQLGVGLGRVDAEWRDHQQRRGSSGRGQAEQAFAATPGERQRHAGGTERHVTAELGRKLQDLVPGNRVAGEGVHRMQCRRTVTRAAAQSGRYRDALGEPDAHAKPSTGCLQDGLSRPHRQVLVRGAGFRPFHLQLHAPLDPLHHQIVM